MKVPPSRLVSPLLLGATTGTSVAPWMSSKIVEVSNNYVVLIVCTIGYTIVAGLLILAMILSPEAETKPESEPTAVT